MANEPRRLVSTVNCSPYPLFETGPDARDHEKIYRRRVIALEKRCGLLRMR